MSLGQVKLSGINLLKGPIRKKTHKTTGATACPVIIPPMHHSGRKVRLLARAGKRSRKTPCPLTLCKEGW